MQKGKPIAFYSQKLNATQCKYTVQEQELLSIVETLWEYQNILLGMKIKIYTDHQNLTYSTYTSDRLHHWRLFIEEYNPQLIHIPWQKNHIADALSKMWVESCYMLDDEQIQDQMTLPLKEGDFPLEWKTISQSQERIRLYNMQSNEQKVLTI